MNKLCNEPLTYEDTCTTLVGYLDFDSNHKHDDNCKTKIFVCTQGHTTNIPILAICPNCDWVGKELCFCHDGIKIHPDSEEATPRLCLKEK